MMRRSLAATFLMVIACVIPRHVRAEDSKPQFPSSLEEMFSEEMADVQGDPTKKAALEGKAHRRIIERLLQILGEADENKRFDAAIALKNYAKTTDIPGIVQVLRKSTDVVQQIVLVEVLGQLKNPLALESLQFVLEHSEPEVKLSAVEALGRIGDPSEIPVLMNILLNTDDLELRKRAASALAMIGGPQALENLQAAYAALPEGGVRRATTFSLAKLQGKINDTYSDTDLPEGRKLTLLYKGMLYYFYRPTERKENPLGPWLLVCVHGSDLDAEATFNLCQPIAKQYRIALLTPLFDNLNFPDYARLNVRGERADKRFLELLDHVNKYGHVKSREVYLFGAEMGGEFVQRFTLAYPGKVARAAFFTERFVNPQFDEYYPSGLKESPISPDLKFDLFQGVKSDFAIILTKEIMANQSYKRFYQGLSDYAEKNGITSRVRLRILPEDGNNLPNIWETAQQYLFPSS